jgi:membrane dipeptidase
VTAAAPASRAAALHARSLVWDCHMDTLQGPVTDGADLGAPSARWHHLAQWRAGGIRAQVFAIWVDTIYAPHHAARRALQQVDAFWQLCERHPDLIEAARTAADVRRIARTGRLAALLSLEGGLAIQNDLALLRTFHRLGVSSMTLTHSNTIDWVDSSTDAPRSHGLSPFGREVVAEMNRLGMVVDVSHVSDAAVRDVLATSVQPVVASHSCARAVCDHPRNLPDELLRAIADGGGVIGVNFYAAFVDRLTWDATVAARADVLARLNRAETVAPDDLDRAARERLLGFFAPPVPVPPAARLVDHLMHMVRVAGEDHVGLGSDLGSPGLPTPVGLGSPADFPAITEALLARGLGEAAVEKILGRNFLRVWEAVTRT